MRNIFLRINLFLFLEISHAWQTAPYPQNSVFRATVSPCVTSSSITRCFLSRTPLETKGEESIEETTKKYGLEAGLFQSLKKEDGGESAKSLLKKYGIAYLATSIPLAIISFAICYVLVDAGVDVQSLLMKIGIGSETANSDVADKAGTVAIAYAAHKAASPIRFPPTVLLTPVVAKLIGKEPSSGEEEGDDVIVG